MDAVPYEIREEDVDEVLSAYEATGGGDFSEDDRKAAHEHVMKNVVDIDDTVRSAAPDPVSETREAGDHTSPLAIRPGEDSPARRGMALAAIEDLLIRDGFIDVTVDERRVFPATSDADEGTG